MASLHEMRPGLTFAGRLAICEALSLLAAFRGQETRLRYVCNKAYNLCTVVGSRFRLALAIRGCSKRFAATRHHGYCFYSLHGDRFGHYGFPAVFIHHGYFDLISARLIKAVSHRKVAVASYTALVRT